MNPRLNPEVLLTAVKKIFGDNIPKAIKFLFDNARAVAGGSVEGMVGTRVASCLYGENRHQVCDGLYENLDRDDPLSLGRFTLLAGDLPSYNNYADIDRMLHTITHIAAGFAVNFGSVPYIAIGVKHGNPCGAATGGNHIEVLEQMIEGDPLALFGGLVITNFPIGFVEAECLRNYKVENGQPRLLDAVVSSSFSSDAVETLSRKGGKCRLLTNMELGKLGLHSLATTPIRRTIRGGFLQQANYSYVLKLSDERMMKTGELTMNQQYSLVLAWAVGSTCNSNTIILVKDCKLIGRGIGQQDRVGATILASVLAARSRHWVKGAVAYSDSFFPFVDGPRHLADVGVSAIFASSGSVRDKEVVALCKERGVVLWQLPDAVCRGFFGH